MARPLIIYLHGFASSPASWKVQALRQYMTEKNRGDRFHAPLLSPVPHLALSTAASLIEQLQDTGKITLIGSSLGGHYATCLAERYDLNAVLINPAVIAQLTPTSFLGEHKNLHTGEKFQFTKEHAAELAAQVCRPTPSRYLLLQEMGDDVLDYRQAAAYYAGCRHHLCEGGDHSFTRFTEFFPQILEFAGFQV